MSTGHVTLRRYALPPVEREGWAIVVIGSDGYFSTVSDWGNYAYIWTHPGCEFRKFLVECDSHYFWTKIMHGRKARVFDEEQTEKNIRKRLWEMMDGYTVDKVLHDEALDALEGRIDDADSVMRWAEDLPFDFDCYDVIATREEPQSWGFATKVFPRFQAMLRAELAAATAGLHLADAQVTQP